MLISCILVANEDERGEELGGLEKAQELIEKGKWEVKFNNEMKTWSLHFPGNGSVKADFVKIERNSFIQKAAKNSQSLKSIKGAGFIANVVGIVLLTESVSQNGWNTENKIDAGIMCVGFIPGVGWGLSLIGLEAKWLSNHFEQLQFEWNNGIGNNVTNEQMMYQHELHKMGVNNSSQMFE